MGGDNPSNCQQRSATCPALFAHPNGWIGSWRSIRLHKAALRYLSVEASMCCYAHYYETNLHDAVYTRVNTERIQGSVVSPYHLIAQSLSLPPSVLSMTTELSPKSLLQSKTHSKLTMSPPPPATTFRGVGSDSLYICVPLPGPLLPHTRWQPTANFSNIHNIQHGQ